MSKQRLFVLDRWPHDHRARTEFEAFDASLGDAPKCDRCGRFTGPLRWLPPYRVRLDLLGPAYGDLVFGPGNDLLVADRVREIVVDSNLTIASRFDPVQIVGVRGASSVDGPVPRYWHIEVGMSPVAIDDARSGVHRDDPAPCEVCRQDGVDAIDRIVLEDHPDPGADLFIARGLPGIFLASARLKDAFDANPVSNAYLVSAEEYSLNFDAPGV